MRVVRRERLGAGGGKGSGKGLRKGELARTGLGTRLGGAFCGCGLNFSTMRVRRRPQPMEGWGLGPLSLASSMKASSAGQDSQTWNSESTDTLRKNLRRVTSTSRRRL